jgi:hypothetical protein
VEFGICVLIFLLIARGDSPKVQHQKSIMKLHNLKPAEGSTHKEKRIVVVKHLVKVVHQLKVTKVVKAVLVTLVRTLLKVVKCPFNVEFLNVDLKTLIE